MIPQHSTVLATQDNMLYTLKLQAVPNPDHGQTNAPAPPKQVTRDTLQALQLEAQYYRHRYNLGAGNWKAAVIETATEQLVATISYNGRLWPV